MVKDGTGFMLQVICEALALEWICAGYAGYRLKL